MYMKYMILFVFLAAFWTGFFSGTRHAVAEAAGYKNSNGHRVTPPRDAGYTLYPVSIMNRRTFDAYNLDPSNGKSASISYTVSKQGKVRIRCVRKKNKSIILRTLQDWTFSDFGKDYSVLLNGRDASGNILNSKEVFFLFEAMDKPEISFHKDHSEKFCRDFELNIRELKDDSDSPGTIKLITTFSSPNLETMKSSGYKGRLFVDYELQQEKEFSATQSTFEFDLSPSSNARHVVTINIDDLHDHIGTATIILNNQH